MPVRVGKSWASRAGLSKGAGNKYGATPTVVDGIRFDSKHEAERYCDLRNLERAGLISDLRLQVCIPLMGQYGPVLTAAGKPRVYKADFVYRNTETGEDVVEDAKGKATALYLLKRDILRAQGVLVVEV